MQSRARRSTKFRALITAAASLPLIGMLPAAAQQSYYGPGWGGGWWMMFGPFTMILFIALTVVLVVLLIRWLGGQGAADRPPPGKSALDILRERFARGEIDKQEFEEKRRILGG
jgi:putative membrane protein